MCPGSDDHRCRMKDSRFCRFLREEFSRSCVRCSEDERKRRATRGNTYKFFSGHRGNLCVEELDKIVPPILLVKKSAYENRGTAKGKSNAAHQRRHFPGEMSVRGPIVA